VPQAPLPFRSRVPLFGESNNRAERYWDRRIYWESLVDQKVANFSATKQTRTRNANDRVTKDVYEGARRVQQLGVMDLNCDGNMR